MRRIRIGKDFTVRWPITINDEAVNLASFDLRLEMHSPTKESRVLDFSSEGNVAIIRISPEVQTSVGSYSFTMWANYGNNGQTAVDSCRAFTLVSRTCAEDDGDHTDLEVDEVVEIAGGDMTFAPVVIEQAPIKVDDELSKTSTNPVQNKVITAVLEDKISKTDANNMYQPKGDYASSDELQGVQDAIEKLSDDIKDIADSDIKWNDVK